MGFIEIIFMGTLGALFVLLALLIYHYKRQLNKLETKYDTMFEIINSLVKEVYQVKNELVEVSNIRIPVQQSVLSDTSGMSYMYNQFLSNMLPTHNEVDEEDDTAESEEIEVIEEEEEEVEGDFTEPVKQVYIYPSSGLGSITEVDISSDDTTPTNVYLSEETIPLDVEEIQQPVLEEVIVQQPQPVSVPQEHYVSDLEDDIVSVMTSERRKPYSKMNLQDLKQEVLNQGITTDISKMKKQEIAQLLRNHKSATASN